MKNTNLLILFMLCGTLVFAGGNEKRAKLIADNMQAALGLSQEQVKQVSDVTVAKLKELEINKTKKDAGNQQLTMIKRKYHEETGKLLTKEQYTKWMELRKEQFQLKKEGKEIKTPVIDAELEYLNG